MILRNVTLQEANGLLPLLREHFYRIHLMLSELQELRRKIGKKKYKRAVFDDKSPFIEVIKKKCRNKNKHRDIAQANDIEVHLEREVSELMRLGVVIRGIMPVHIDFLSSRNNEPIFLCWHGGEQEIQYWHYLDDGGPHRHVIAEKNSFGPHMVH